MLLAYIPPVYNMTFKIVREKETRAKETMRIMGMTDLPYWFSWFFFYSCINFVVSTLAWAILLFKVVNYSQPMFIWIFFFLCFLCFLLLGLFLWSHLNNSCYELLFYFISFSGGYFVKPLI